MIGGPSYPSSFRQKRSFRKVFLALFVVFAILVWHSGKLTSIRDEDHDLTPGPRTGSNGVQKSGYLHHRHQDPAPVERDSENPPTVQLAKPVDLDLQEPTPEKGSVAPHKDATLRRLSDDDSSDEHDIDTIESIKESTGDKVEHESKLLHPDDDDETLTDSENPKVGSAAVGHTDDDEDASTDSEDPKVRSSTVGDAQKKIQDDALDAILKADHPSKEPEAQSSEEDAEVEDGGPEEDATNAPRRIEVLHEMTPWSADYSFPTWDECEGVKERSDTLPDMIHVPFEESVRDVRLEGWEDAWISKALFKGPKLEEPKIDFVYNWVNGSQIEFQKSMLPYETNSSLNDAEGNWMASHATNRYREWNELRYSMRSVEKFASHFTNQIQILVNAFQQIRTDESQPITYGKQKPHWLRDDVEKVKVLSQEEFFGPEERKCLPTFDSLTIENQLYNTKSETDRLFALSDDMILGKPHAASDLYSPLFGPTLGFKDNAYNTLKPPTEEDADRFGEKPFLIYSSWLLNRRFGARKRKGQVHFGHSLSRSITKEAITSFPRPALRSAFQRFRGETGFQLYSWFVIFHYTMERHREALLWSYIMLRSDVNDDGYLSWDERKKILKELGEGMSNETPELYRRRIYYRMAEHHEQAGLQPPKVNTDVLWTSLDGPAMIKDLDCDAFDTEDCLAPGFSMESSDAIARSPVFSSAAILDRISRQSPRCGDCLIKLILNRRRAGLGPLLPGSKKKPRQREIVVKALIKYSYSIVKPDAEFYMVTDAEQAEHALLKPYLKKKKSVGQICLNDDVATSDPAELKQLGNVMSVLFEGLFPEPSSFET